MSKNFTTTHANLVQFHRNHSTSKLRDSAARKKDQSDFAKLMNLAITENQQLGKNGKEECLACHSIDEMWREN